MIVDKIGKYLTENNLVLDEAIKYEIEKLAGWTFKRQFMNNEERDNKGKLYLSSCGKCARQLAYGFHGIEKSGKELDARSKIVFWMGDLVEMTIVSLARLAGCTVTATGLNQITVKLPGTEIYGHPDGLILHDNKLVLLEVKSMSSYSFERFEKGDLDDTYIAQINAYMECLGVTECCVCAINKDSGVMNERIIMKDDRIVAMIKANIVAVLNSTIEKLPEPKYEVNDKGFYPWQCLYCAYWCKCRTNAEKVVVGQSYKLKEKKDGISRDSK